MADISQLVQKALNGDSAAFDALYAETNKAVFFICIGFLKNEEDARDITQEVYITAFEKLGTLESPEKFGAWIKRIAVNKCKNFLVKKNAHLEQSIDSEENVTELVDENFLPEEYAENAEKRRIVMEIVRNVLSDTLYQTVMMFYFDELSIAEIAEIMDCPEGTVKYRLNAARAKIKKGVLDYEKKNDEKLYAVAGIPFLARLFAEFAKNTDAPQIPIENVLPKSSSAPDVSQAVTNGGKKMLNSLKSKIIAGACAAVVVGGGVTAGVLVSKNAAKPTSTFTSTPAVTYSAGPNSVVAGNTSKPSVSTPSSEPSPEAVKFAATDEIKNAALNSGLVQYNNDIFQSGGYMTVADFVEKYKDSYDISYSKNRIYAPIGPYEECKDYLIEYERSAVSSNYWQNNKNCLLMTPKGIKTKNGRENRVQAVVVNATSPDEKIPLNKAVVAEVVPYLVSADIQETPGWLPMGFSEHHKDIPGYNTHFEYYENVNENYTEKSICEMLEAKGLKKFEELVKGSWNPDSRKSSNYNMYWLARGEGIRQRVGCYVLGEENLFGARPLYRYDFYINEDTDIVESVSVAIDRFVK